MNKNVPNILTIARIIMIPFVILFYYLQIPHWNLYAAVIFIVASLTDMLDGMIARKYNLVSNFGKLMDPMADKVLFMAALILVLDWGKLGKFGPVVVILLLAREFLISGVRLIAAAEGVVIPAGKVGKWKTVFQLIGISMILLENPIFSAWNIPLGEILVYLSTILSVWSCIEYIYHSRDLLKG